MPKTVTSATAPRTKIVPHRIKPKLEASTTDKQAQEIIEARINFWNSTLKATRGETPLSSFEITIPQTKLRLDLNKINPRDEEANAITLAADLEAIQGKFRSLQKKYKDGILSGSEEDKTQLLVDLTRLQQALPVEAVTGKLEDLRELRKTIFEAIELADKIISSKKEKEQKELFPLLSKLNKASIEINIAVLYLQLKKAEAAIHGELNLPADKKFPTNTAILCLEGATETAINLAWEYGFRAERKLAAETIEKEIRVPKTETLDEEGNIISATYTINGFDVKVSASEKDLEKVSLRQRVWINSHTTLDEIKNLIEKGERELASEKLDLLISVYDPNRPTFGKFDERQPKYEERLTEINEALHALKMVITELKRDKDLKEVLAKILGTIDDVKGMIKNPKQSVWKEFDYSSFDKAFRGKLHTLLSIENDYRILHRNMAYLNHFAGIIQKAEKRESAHDKRVKEKIIEVRVPYKSKSFLAKKRKESITKRVQELEIWSGRGFVYEKQHSQELLQAALNNLEQREYANAKNTIDTVSEHLKNRMRELVDIANAVKEKAFKVFLEYRDSDVKNRADRMIELVGKNDFGEALKETSEIRARYFTQAFGEYGYQRARKLLDVIEAEIRSAETRKRHNKLKDADITKITSELQKLKEDIDKKDLFRIPVVIVSKGKNHPQTLFIKPGETFNLLILHLKDKLKELAILFRPNAFLVKTDGNWITKKQHETMPLPDNRPVIIVTEKPHKKS